MSVHISGGWAPTGKFFQATGSGTIDDPYIIVTTLTDSYGNSVNVTEDGDLSVSDNSTGLAIAEGNVTGKTFIHKFGQTPDFDTGDGFVTIWDGADDGNIDQMNYVFSTTADIDSISSNASDYQNIEVQGLDANYDVVTQTVTLNGTTRVALSTSLIRVFRMKNIGTVDLSGYVYCYVNSAITGGVPNDSTKVRAVIQADNNQTLMAVYTIPNGKTGYMRDWYAAASNATGGFFATDGTSTVKVKARPFGQVFQLKHISSLKSDGTGHIQHKYEEPEVFQAKTDIIMECNTSVNGSSVAGGFDIVLEDN